jgi:hypothetical protein
MGGQASWLLPAALIGIVAVFVARRRTPRTDRVRAAAIVWGGWLLVTGLLFSYGQGVIHTYYTVALAPAIAAVIGIAGRELWTARSQIWARVLAALMVLTTTGWAWVLLDRTPSWHPVLRLIIVVTGLLGGASLLVAPVLRRSGRWVWGAIAVLVLSSCLVGPAAFAAQTIGTAHMGSIPSAGPGSSTTPGGGPGAGGRGGPPGGAPDGAGRPGSGAASAGSDAAAAPPPGGRAGSGAGGPTSTGASGKAFPTGAPRGGTALGGGTGGGVTTSKALVNALEASASKYRWVAAVEGSQSAASLELATSGEPVMAIGGFNGQGGDLTLAAFKSYVARGDIHYFIAGGGMGGGGIGGGGSNSTATIASWVEAHFTAKTIGGETVYDLSPATTNG